MGLQPPRPTVYLDQWVWIRLARVAHGRPAQVGDVDVLRAVEAAARAGVVFPLSATHYFETQHMPREGQRQAVGSVMARISHCRTLRGGGELLRHQFLSAMHELLGRPMLAPPAPRVVGLGAAWALVGVETPLQVHDGKGSMDLSSRPWLARWIVQANQHAEYRCLTGPVAGEVGELRARGYAPEKISASAMSRLEWEQVYADIVTATPIDRNEMRVQLLARQLVHEHLQLLSALAGEYGLSLGRIFGPGREEAVAFAEHVPTLVIAADLKTELFRAAGNWSTSNHLYDVDAMSQAVPYCHIVVPDKEMRDLLARSDAGRRYGTNVARLTELPDLLGPLSVLAGGLGDDPSFWSGLTTRDSYAVEIPATLPLGS